MNRYGETPKLMISVNLGTVGFITWIVFLILKLCNQSNPDFAWLTWFWVWFPLWIPWALSVTVIGLIIIVALIVTKIKYRRMAKNIIKNRRRR